MALSQLRPMVIEGDRPAPAQPASGFTRLPDGSLVMRGQKPVEAKPGVLAGFRKFIEEKLRPSAPAQQDQFWIPQAQPAAPVAAAPAAPMAPGTPLPQYDAWAEIEQEAAKEKAIADQLGTVSKKVMESPQLIEGRWFR